jgi:hypothetical protein
LQRLVVFTHGSMKCKGWLRRVVADAPHELSAVIAACEGS